MSFDLRRLLDGDRQGSDGTMRNRMAHLRWLAGRIGKPGIVRRDNANYGSGTGL